MISCCHCRLSTYALSRAYSQMLCCYRDYLLLLLSFVIAGLSYGSMLILPALAVACLFERIMMMGQLMESFVVS